MSRGCLYFIGMNVFRYCLACNSLYVRTVRVWRCEHAWFSVEVSMRIYYFSFIHLNFSVQNDF